MGESYKSLTIRIGADDSALKGALRNIEQAARQTQEQLRLMSRALMLDSSRVDSTEKKLRLMRASAETTATQLNLVNRTLLDYAIGNKNITKMAREWGNVAQEAYRVKEAYDTNNERLNSVKQKLLEVAKEHKLAFDPKELDKYLSIISRIDDNSAKLVQSYRSLSREQEKLNNKWTEAKEVMRYDNAINQAHVLEAQLKNVYTRIAELESKAGVNKLAPSLESARVKAQAFSNEISRTNETLHILDESLRINPKNIDLLVQKGNALYQKTTLVNGKINELNKVLRQLESSGIQTSTESMMKLEEKAQQAKDDFVAISTNLDKARGRLSNLNDEATKFKTAIKAGEDIEKNNAALAKTKERITEAKAAVRSLEGSAEKARQEMSRKDAELEYKKVYEQVKKLELELNSLRGTAQKSNMGLLNSIRDISTTLAATLTPLALTGLYRIVSSAEKIDSAYRDMRKTVEGTEEQFESLRQSAIELSKTSIVSADQILEIEAMGGQLGLAVEDLETFARVSSNLDIATDLSSEQISTQLGQLNNLLEFGAGDMERYGDALVRLGNNMPTTESRISGVTTAIGAAAHQFGMSTPEILAWSAAIASTGQGTEAAGTAISNTMYDIESAVNGTSDKAKGYLEGFAKTAGMTADEFADAWNNNASYAMQEFVKGLKQLELDGGSASNRLSELGINAVRQRRALLGLSQTVGNLDNALSMSKHAWNGVSDQWGKAGDAAIEADKKMQGFSGLVGKLKNNAAALGSTIGESLVPILQVAVKAFQGFNDVISAVPKPILSMLTGATALIAALAPIGRILGQAKITIVQFQDALYKSRVGRLMEQAATAGMTEEEARNIMKMREANQVRRNKILGIKEETAAIKEDTAAQKGNTAATQAGSAANTKATATTKTLTTATKAKYAALNAAKVAAGLLALEGIMVLAQAIGELIEDQKNVTLATKNLESSFKSAVISTKTNTDAIRLLGKEAEVAIPSFKNLAATQAQISGAIIETNKKMIENVDNVRAYAEVVNNLTDRSGLTAEQIANLKIAVDGLNTATGESLYVEQDEAGVWHVMKDEAVMLNDEIQKLIDSKIVLIQLDASRENAAAAMKAEQEAAAALGAAQQQLAEAKAQAAKEEAEYGRATAETANRVKVLESQVGQYQTTADSAAKASQFYKDQLVLLQMVADGNATEIQKVVASNFALQGALQSANVDIIEFTKYLETVGVTAEDVENISAEKLAELIEDYKVTYGLIEEEVDKSKDNIQKTTGDAFKDVINTINEESPNLVAEAAEMLGLTEDQFKTFAWNAGIRSKDAMVNFCNGIKNGEYDAELASKAVASVTELPLTTMNSLLWGSHLGLNFAKGLEGTEDEVNAAANVIANAASAILGFSVPEEGVWSGAEKGGVTSGQHLVQNFIAGMKSEEEALRSEAERLGEILYNAVNGYDYASVSSRAYDASAAAINANAEYRTAAVSASVSASSQTITRETQYILSGDINITTQNGNPEEIVNEIVHVFTVAQNAYA